VRRPGRGETRDGRTGSGCTVGLWRNVSRGNEPDCHLECAALVRKKRLVADTEITLQSILRILTRRWRWVAGFTLLTFVVVWVAAYLLLDDVYTASVKLLISKSKVGEKITPVDYTMLELDTYGHLVKSRDGLVEALRAFSLDAPPYDYELKQFEDCIQVRPLRNTELLEIEVALPEPQLARDVANDLARRTIDKNFDLLLRESKKSREMFQAEVDKAHQRTVEVANNLAAFMKQSKTGVSGHYFLSSQEALWKMKQDRAFNIALRDESEAKIQALTEILRREPETRILRRAISDEQDLLEVFRKKHPELPTEELLQIMLESENVNYAYDKAKAELIDASKDYFGAIAHVAAMDVEIQRIEEEIRLAEQEMADKKRLENELESASQDYQEVSAKNAEANTTIAGERQELTVIQHAVAPERPSGPNRLAIAVSAALFAFLLALFVSLAMDLYGTVDPVDLKRP